LIVAYGVTEPAAGSNVAAIETRADRILDDDGNITHYKINGTKQFITSGDIADVVTVMAMTDKSKGARGISAFIVEKDTKGFKVGQLEDKLGLRGSHTAELIFEDCRIVDGKLVVRNEEYSLL